MEQVNSYPSLNIRYSLNRVIQRETVVLRFNHSFINNNF